MLASGFCSSLSGGVSMRVMRWGFALVVVAVISAAIPANAEIVDREDDVGKYTSIALDSNGYPHISYYDYTNKDLKYAHKDANGWHTETADGADCEEDVGEFTSIALDSDGYPHISYYDDTSEALKYAYKDYSGWNTETVDSGGVGSYTSIALDSNDYPHISYYDWSNGDLKYAYKDSSGWHIELVDEEGFVGDDTSIALDSNGYPHISYNKWISSSSGELRYAYKDSSGDWHIEVVDSGGNAQYTSIALDSNGYPHIGYYDSCDLKYAYKDSSGDWHIETVDRYIDGYISLALDSNGYPHISYRLSLDLMYLMYAYKDSSGWHIEVVDSERYVEPYSIKVKWHTSIALDSNDYPHISYYDYANGDLKYTTIQPTIVNLQGGLTDSNGDPLSTASIRVTIKKYGQIVYQETFNDVVKDGKFSVLLGATQKLELWEGTAYNLIIEVDVDSTTFGQADVTFGDNNPAGDKIVFYP